MNATSTDPMIRPESPVAGAGDARVRHEANRLAWHEGAVRYTEEIEETIAFMAADKSNLHPVERANLGDLRAWCHTAIHCQCASGRDALHDIYAVRESPPDREDTETQSL